MEPAILFSIVALLTAVLLLWSKAAFLKVTIYDYQVGLLYRKGRFQRRLLPGQYRFLKAQSHVVILDTRRRELQVPGQEILTQEGAAVKVSLVAEFQVIAPEVAHHQVQSYELSLHTALQLALRTAVAGLTVEGLMAERAQIGEHVLALCQPQLTALGIQLHAVGVRDIMLPAELKRAFAEVLKARQEGQAALERARGEQAALRSLANAARLIEEQPALLQLRWLQTVGQTTGNSVVVGGVGPQLPQPEKK